MDSYKIQIAPHALQQLNQYVDYIQFTLLNSQAADSVYQDALETIDVLSLSAGSLEFCKSKKLRDLGFRHIKFQKHDYVMIYDTEGNTARIKAIYHELQDYENVFSDYLGI